MDKKKKPSLFKINLNDKKLFLSVYKFSFSGWMVSTLSTIKNFDIHIIGFFLILDLQVFTNLQQV